MGFNLLTRLFSLILCDVESARQSDWDSIVACHRGYLMTTTWNYQKGSMGAHRLEPQRFNKNRALNVHATVAKYITGHVQFVLVYNEPKSFDKDQSIRRLP